MKYVSCEDASRVLREAFGDDVRIVLEPEAVFEQKKADGKESELWSFDAQSGKSGREDGRFFDIRYVDRGGWGQLALYQEPNLQGRARIVGQNILEVNSSGRVRIREAMGLNGSIIESAPSSISKGVLEGPGAPRVGVFEADPQRINGFVEVIVVQADFPDADGMTPAEIKSKSTDSRLLSSLAKAGLL